MATHFKTAFFAALISLHLPANAGSIEEDFQTPPLQAKTHVWWHWMSNYISKEGITKDLEAMAGTGIGGATIFNIYSPVGSGPGKAAWPQNAYRSPEWWALVEHAAREADRLGLNLGMHNCVGYSASGGPWGTRREAGQWQPAEGRTVVPVVGPNDPHQPGRNHLGRRPTTSAIPGMGAGE